MALYAKMKGPVDYTVVGSPTITDGVVSNFSNANYIQTSENFSFENPLEIYFTATTSSNVNTSQLFCSVGNGGANRSFGVTIETGGKMGVAYTFNGSSWVGWLPSSYVFEGNTRYNFLIQYIPSQFFKINVKKSTETSWTTFTNSLSAPIYTSANCPFIFGQNYQNKPFLGSIDLNETYIKKNDQLWFGHGPQRVKIRTAPYTRCTVYGTPTIIGGIASNFSNTNYLKINQTYNSTNNKNVEIYVRAKTPTTITSSFNPIFGADSVNYFGIFSYSNSAFGIRMGYYSGTLLNFGDIYISGGVQADTWYRFKIKGNNGIWRAEVYDDNNTLLKSADKDWSNTPFSQNYDILLRCVDNTKAYSGSIDLNVSYIKIDGQYWWRGDMQYAETYTLRLGD